MTNPKDTSLQVIITRNGDQWKHVVIFAGEHTARKLRAGVLDDGPVVAFTSVSSSPAILDISLKDGEAVNVRAIEL